MHYTFHLRTVTEVFAGGANIQDSELRPSAFRGPLRFWFRAMMGKIVGNDLACLKHLESLAFGATDAASPFRLRIHHREIVATQPPSDANYIGLNYLGFSMKERKCLPENFPFTVEVRFRSPNKPLEQVVLGSCWLLLHFGGIGSRTRRSFGTLCADQEVPNLPFKFQQPPDILMHYQEGFKVVEDCFREFAKQYIPSHIAAPAFTSFYGWSGRLLRDWHNVFELQECLGRILRGFRNGALTHKAPWDMDKSDLQVSTRTQDYLKTVGNYLDTGSTAPKNLNNDALGLPIVFFSSSRKKREQQASRTDYNYQMRPWTATAKWKDPQTKKWHDRRASPIFLHPIKMTNGRFAALIVAFPNPFLPLNATEQLLPGGPKESQIRPSHNNPLPIQTAMASDVTTLVADLFTQIDKHFGKDSLPLP